MAIPSKKDSNVFSIDSGIHVRHPRLSNIDGIEDYTESQSSADGSEPTATNFGESDSNDDVFKEISHVDSRVVDSLNQLKLLSAQKAAEVQAKSKQMNALKSKNEIKSDEMSFPPPFAWIDASFAKWTTEFTNSVLSVFLCLTMIFVVGTLSVVVFYKPRMKNNISQCTLSQNMEPAWDDNSISLENSGPPVWSVQNQNLTISINPIRENPIDRFQREEQSKDKEEQNNDDETPENTTESQSTMKSKYPVIKESEKTNRRRIEALQRTGNIVNWAVESRKNTLLTIMRYRLGMIQHGGLTQKDFDLMRNHECDGQSGECDQMIQRFMDEEFEPYMFPYTQQSSIFGTELQSLSSWENITQLTLFDPQTGLQESFIDLLIDGAQTILDIYHENDMDVLCQSNLKRKEKVICSLWDFHYVLTLMEDTQSAQRLAEIMHEMSDVFTCLPSSQNPTDFVRVVEDWCEVEAANMKQITQQQQDPERFSLLKQRIQGWKSKLIL